LKNAENGKYNILERDNNMKPAILITSFFLITCTSKEIDPTSIVGKWEYTGITQYNKFDGTYSPWRVNPTFVAVPNSFWEFTKDGYFFRNGKSGAECCSGGNKYSILGDKISFTETLNCPNVSCLACSIWKIEKIGIDTLILDECYAKNKYVRVQN
jgi:hypothetical protein